MNTYTPHTAPKSLGKTFARVDISEQSFREADQILVKLEFETRTIALEKAMRKAAAPFVRIARQLAPDSIKTGSRDLWSPKLKAARAHTPQHKKTIGVSSIRNYSGGLIAIYAGPLYPAGNLINAIGHPHKQVLWGRPTGKTLPPNDYLKDAAKQVGSEAQSAFISSLTEFASKITAAK